MSPEETECCRKKIDLDIFYEDDEVLVINKAAGMVVHGKWKLYSVLSLNGIAWYLQQKDPSITESTLPRYGLVHPDR